ncbi:MAG: hypothetical protein M0Q53_21520 [Prolixibacteraceae bacterium]|jgi:hypothetical protein|nr:hypothetical protein [Prolixibacteraceae bacterium]
MKTEQQGIGSLKNRKRGCLKTALCIIGFSIFFMITCVQNAINRKERMDDNREKYMADSYDNMTSSDELPTLSIFTPPDSWDNYNIADAFTISVPPTMELRRNDDQYTEKVKDVNWYGYKINTNIVVFQQKGLAKEDKEAYNTYCRVMIDLHKGSKGDFVKATNFEELSVEDVKTFQDLAKQSAAPFKIIDSPKVRYVDIGSVYGVQVEYLREGQMSKNTHVAMYYLFNYDEYANITVSYSQKDALKWKADLSNVIKTFKWNIIK